VLPISPPVVEPFPTATTYGKDWRFELHDDILQRGTTKEGGAQKSQDSFPYRKYTSNSPNYKKVKVKM
jgi:hypothetical protein